MIDFTKRWDSLTAQERKEIYLTYKEEKGDDACCDSVIQNYFLKKKRQLKLSNMKTNNFKLKSGALMDLPSKNIHVTNANLTDEIALELLADDRNRKHFEKITEMAPVKESKEDVLLELEVITPEEPKRRIRKRIEK